MKYRKIGRNLLSALIEIAQEEKAIACYLNSQLSAVGFYQKLGFKTFGEQFSSGTTGVAHIGMKYEISLKSKH